MPAGVSLITRTIVTDNGPPFSGAEFNNFCNKNGIDLTRPAPYHSESNGMAENSVGIVKDKLNKALSSDFFLFQ